MIPVGGTTASPQADASWRSPLPGERRLLQNEERLSTGILAAVPSVPSPEPPAPDSPQVSVVHSLPLQSPGYVAANKIVCIAPLRDSLHLQPSLPSRQKPCCYSQLDVIWGPFQLWCSRLGSPAWGLVLTLLRGNPRPLKYPSGTSAAARGSPASPPVPPLHSLPVSL